MSPAPVDYRALYSERVAPLATPVVDACRSAMRAGVPGGLVALAGLVGAGWMLLVHDWPPRDWWAHRDSQLAIGLAALVALAGVTAGGWMAAPAAARRQRAAQRFERDVLPAVCSALRPGAAYRPDGAIGEKWISRSALVAAGNRYASAHEVRWRAGEVSYRLAHVRVEHHTTSVSRDHGTTTVHFVGEVAVADLPVSAGGYVRLRARRTQYERAPEVAGLAPVEPSVAELGVAYEVHASSPAVAAAVLTPALAGALAEFAAGRRGAHVAIAHREVVVAFERHRGWFDRLPLEFGEEHFLEMAGMLDLVEGVAAAVVGAVRQGGTA